jgi:hypothetical protein
MQQGKLMLQAAKERAQQSGITDPITSQRHGSVTESLIDLEDIISVLVLGVRGEDHEQQQEKISSRLEMMVRAIHRPILVVNDEFKTACSISFPCCIRILLRCCSNWVRSSSRCSWLPKPIFPVKSAVTGVS